MEPVEYSPLFWCEFQKLLKIESLDRLRWGMDPEFCDEVPLYSRYDHLSFLGGLSVARREQAILLMATWLWRDVEARLMASGYGHSYMLFLSIWEWEAEDYPVPYLFFCGSNVSQLDAIERRVPSSAVSRRVLHHLDALGLGPHGCVFEDHATDPGRIRVLVDFDMSSGSNKVLLKG